MRRACVHHAVILAVLLCWSATMVEAAGGAAPPGRFWVDLGIGCTWARGNDVRVAERTTATREPDGLLELDVDTRPLLTQPGCDTTLLAEAGFAGDSWGIRGQLWQLGNGASTDDAFELGSTDQILEGLQIWGAFTNPISGFFGNAIVPGDYSLSAENDLSLHSGRLEVTRSVGSYASVALGLHVARLENDRSELLTIASTDYLPRGEFSESDQVTSGVRGWLFGPSVGLRLSGHTDRAVAFSLSLSQSVLLTRLEHEGVTSIRTSFREAQRPDQPLAVVSLTTRFSARAAVPVTEARGVVEIDLTERLSIRLDGLFSVWHDVPVAMQYSVADGSGPWLEQQRTLVFARVGPSLRFRF